MSDLIRRGDAIKAFCMDCKGQSEPCEHSGTCKTLKVLRNRKKIPAVEPKQGEWIDAGADLDGTWYYRCSECSAEVENVEYPHCPYCLASMEGTDNDTD